MTLNDFVRQVNLHSTITVRSGYNEKILCRKFDIDKHYEIGERELISVWADTVKTGYGPSYNIVPILCCYVDGKPEYDKEVAKTQGVVCNASC